MGEKKMQPLKYLYKVKKLNLYVIIYKATHILLRFICLTSIQVTKYIFSNQNQNL